MGISRFSSDDIADQQIRQTNIDFEFVAAAFRRADWLWVCCCARRGSLPARQAGPAQMLGAC